MSNTSSPTPVGLARPLICQKPQPTRSTQLPLPRTTAQQLLDYARWAQDFDKKPADQMISAVVCRAVADLLGADCLWQKAKTSPPRPDPDDTDPGQATPENRGPGRPRKEEQPAPLLFLPTAPLTTRVVQFPEKLASELDDYLQWLVESHRIDRQVLLVRALERALDSFFRRDPVWQQSRQTP